MTGQQLKNSILQLAIQGRLVAQDPADEPAGVLLQRIRQERQRLVKEGKLKKKDLTTTPITEEEKPFDIPETWEWCRLGDYCERVTDYVASGSFASLKANVPVLKDTGYAIMVKTADFANNFTSNLTYTTKEGYEFLANSNLFGGELIITNIGATLGKVSIVPFLNKKMTLAPNSVMIRIFEDTHRDYLKYYLSSPQGYAEMKEISSGTAMKKFNKTDLKTILIAIPPLSEQRRIVARIEELMPLVEAYGKAQEELEALNAGLPEALKKSILQEAIQGRLVPQDANDEPASVLLARIRKEKEQLVKAGKLKKKDLTTTPITEEEKPFDIPETWEWCRLGEICSFLSRGRSPKYSDVRNQYPVFAQKCNLKEGGISLEQARFLNPDSLDKWKEEYKLQTDDILVNSTGTGTVCRTRLFHEKYLGNYPFTLPDSHVSVVRTFSEICSAFYYLVFNSKYIQDYWEERLAGSTNQKELYIGTLQETIIPLPPLSEQRRIVSKIEALFAEIDKMQGLH